MRISRTASRAAILSLLLVAGCSLVNAFDDIIPLPDGTYGPATAVPGDANSNDLPIDGMADTTNTPDVRAPAAGAIVLGGTVETADGVTASVLTVLDPATGKELGPRETMVVSSVRYDGARDIWFIMESSTSDFQMGPSDTGTLHVRTLNLSTGVWTELSKVQVPPLQSYDSIIATRDRLSYVAWAPADGATLTTDFVTLDTSNTASVQLLNRLPLEQTPTGVVGLRSTTGAGGNLALVRVLQSSPSCTGAGQARLCPLELVPIRIPNAGLPAYFLSPLNAGLVPASAVPSYGSFESSGRNILIAPRLSSNPDAGPDASPDEVAAALDRTYAHASLYEAVPPQVDGLNIRFLLTDNILRRAAIAECAKVAFVVGANGDTNLHAVPVNNNGLGTPTKISTLRSGQSVYFEPTTSTALAPFGQGAGHDIGAYKLGGTPLAPTLEPRTANWSPPSDIRPIILGIREPYPIVCP